MSDVGRCSRMENTEGRTENPRVAGSIPALATDYSTPSSKNVNNKRRATSTAVARRLYLTPLLDASCLLQPAVAQSDHLIERGVAVPARLHALNEPPRHAVVAGPAKLLQEQPLVPRLLQRRDVGRIDAVIACLYQLLG